jgi:PAS domain S-box-containing protein
MRRTKVKTPRDAPGMYNLKGIPASQRDVASKIVPFRAPRNLRHCHYLKGIRDINRIEWKEWEPGISKMLRGVEKQRLGYANQFYHALERVQTLVEEGRRREEKLQAATEELEANYEELQATTEEMESTNEELQATTEELERTNGYRQSLMDSMLDILMTTDLSGVITEVNRATEQLSGYSKDELIGQPFHKFFTDPDSAQAGIERVLTEGEVSNYDLTIATKDGREIPVSYNATVLRDPDGRITGVLGSARDMTELKEAEEHLRLASVYNGGLIEASLDPVVTIDPDGKITDVNSATETATGCSREELIGTDFSNYFTEPHKAREGYQQVFEEESIKDYALELKHKDGGVTPVLYNASVYRDEAGSVIGAFAAARDVTKLRQAEEGLKHSVTDLSRSNEELEQFAYVASHDLQEPLRMVSSYVQLLEKRYKGKMDSDADEFIGFAVDGANRMQVMINDLLTFSRLSTRGDPFKPTDCDEAFDRAIFNLKKAVEESNATITHDPLPTVTADKTQLEQLFQNLIGNAIKFRGEEPPRIHLSCEKIEDSAIQIPQSAIDTGWIFSVKDNGIGIELEHAERIFGIFQRLHTREQYPGSGIGLAVCKKIVQRHGGQIWIESEAGKGSTFYFTIPERE